MRRRAGRRGQLDIQYKDSGTNDAYPYSGHYNPTRNPGSNGLLVKVENGTVNSQSDGDWAAMSVLEAVETGYDSNARPVTRKLVAGGSVQALTQTGYDALGRPECAATRMNPAAFGVVVTDQSGSRRGLLLPDVESIETAGQQVGVAARKAGIKPGEPLRLYRFRTRRFKESA